MIWLLRFIFEIWCIYWSFDEVHNVFLCFQHWVIPWAKSGSNSSCFTLGSVQHVSIEETWPMHYARGQVVHFLGVVIWNIIEMTAQWTNAAFCGQHLLYTSLSFMLLFLTIRILDFRLKYLCIISLHMRMCLLHIPKEPASSTSPAACAIHLPSSSTYSAIQNLAAPSWFS